MMRLIYPDNSAIMAPIAGYTDMPARLSAARHGCRFAFTEMIDAGSLVFSGKKTQRLAVRGPQEEFLGIQLVGSDPVILRQAVEIINDMNFDVLDFNLGCPAPKVAKKGEGITLALKNPDLAIQCLEVLTKYSRIPVTAKTRIQSETDPEVTAAFCKRLENAGASAVTVHGRVMKVFYSGPVFYDIVKAVRESVNIQVIANGGALTPESYHTLLKQTGCTCGMIARGAMGNPWIFEALNDSGKYAPTVKEFSDELETHIRSMIDFYGEEQGFKIARKTMLEYLRGRGFPSALRASVSFLSGFNTFRTMMMQIHCGPSAKYWEYLESHPEEVERPMRRVSSAASGLFCV